MRCPSVLVSSMVVVGLGGGLRTALYGAVEPMNVDCRVPGEVILVAHLRLGLAILGPCRGPAVAAAIAIHPLLAPIKVDAEIKGARVCVIGVNGLDPDLRADALSITDSERAARVVWRKWKNLVGVIVGRLPCLNRQSRD